MSDNISKKILFVDDEPNILQGYQRRLRKSYDIDIATSGALGLTKIKENGPYSIIISDFKMPQMNGAEFLEQAQKVAPGSIKMLLTGQADLDAVVDCVNKGAIFKFLLKPCDTDTMAHALRACQEQYELIRSEKILLEKTLKGSIRILSDILSLASPRVFGYSARLRRHTEYAVKTLGLKPTWPYVIAAMLAHIGFITLETELLNKVFSGKELTADEQTRVKTSAQTGADLLKKIPKLEQVSDMIAEQYSDLNKLKINKKQALVEHDKIQIGAQLLQLASIHDKLIQSGMTKVDCINNLKLKADSLHPDLFGIFTDYGDEQKQVIQQVNISQLREDMLFAEDVQTTDGLLLAVNGQEVSPATIARLKNFSARLPNDKLIKVIAG